MKLVLNCLILIVLLSGCGIFKKNVFAKRKYTKGYFIESRHSNKELEVRNNKKSNVINKLIKAQNKSIDNVSLNQQKRSGDNQLPLKDSIKTKKIGFINRLAFSSGKENPLYVEKVFSVANYANKILVSIDGKSDGGNSIEAVEFILYSILFVFLAIVYTASILLKSPGFPLVLAIPIAVVLALLSVITGVYFF